ncbi:hypothetical protein HXX01_03445 [Candidatus Nomurabacteria bacterium]|nr:hypothetical protein [Candidatus Nomurabacteria bacterium]
MNKHRYNIFPEMNQEEYTKLKNDILLNGYDETMPIYLFENEILDGWNRYKVCNELSIIPIYEVFEGKNIDAINYVLRTNKRRNLTSSQWAAVAVTSDEIINSIKYEVKEEMKKKVSEAKTFGNKLPKVEDTRSDLIISDTFNTNRAYINKANNLKENHPVKFGEVFLGIKTITEAEKEIRKEERDKKRQEFIELGKNVIDLSDLIDIRQGDFTKVLADIPDNSIDLILTDPPYPYQYIECWSELARFAQDKLKDGGFMIAYSGHIHLPEVINRVLNEGLKWYWIGVCYHNGYNLSQVHEVNVFAKHKPILFFYKGNKVKPNNWFNDVFESNNEETKDFHEWGQSVDVFDKIIKIFEPKNVVDPFLGGGTTGIACLMNNVKFIGAEIDEDSFNISKKRIFDYGK